MKNKKEKIENWRKRFDKKFSLSDFWLNPNNYPKNYRDIIAFIEKERKIVEDNTLKHIEEDYQEFIKEIRQEEKEKWLNLILERIKLKEKKVHYISTFLEMSHEKIRQEADEMGYNQAIEDLEKLKEEIKKELKVGEK